MSTHHEIFRTRAIEARRDAETAELDNVRDRHLRAAAAWEAMAERGEWVEKSRAETDARKAAALEEANDGRRRIVAQAG